MTFFTLTWALLLPLLLPLAAAQNSCHRDCRCGPLESAADDRGLVTDGNDVTAAAAPPDDDWQWDGSTMRCRSAGLTAPPEGYWSWVRTLELDGNDIERLYDYSFSGFQSARTITIRNNRLTTFNPDVFYPATYLINLIVSSNVIDTVLMGQYSNYNLEYLDLSDNRIQRSIEYSLSLYGRLQTLDLSKNPLKTSAETYFLNHYYLQNIYLQGIDASELSNVTFGELYNLRTLDISHSNVSDIKGVFVGGSSYLYNITLKGNQITKVTAGSLPATLKQLDLRANPLERLDVPALSEGMPGGDDNAVHIEDTPLACECRYEPLLWWGYGRRVAVRALCGGEDLCRFDLFDD